MTDVCTGGRMRRWLPFIAAAFAILGAAFALAVLPGPPAALAPPIAVGLLAQLAATVLVARLPTHRHIGLAAVAVVAGVMQLADSPWRALLVEQGVIWVPLALAWATVLVVEDARTPRQLRISGAILLGYLLVVGVRATLDGDSALAAVLSAAGPVLGGVSVSLARRLRQARRDRVAALARERAAAIREAREQERQKVAAEMHDTLGHVLTLLVLHANALAVTTTEGNARQAAEQMSRLGTEGLAELRQLLDLLGTSGHAPPPEVAELVDEARAAGQSVQLVLAEEFAAVPQSLARTVRQVVREGLTNARKHAPGAEVLVEIKVADTIDVLVRNGRGEPDPGPGNGIGLAGLRRRVALLGGHCEHAPTGDGGYALRASLPAGGSTPDERDGTWTELAQLP
ncbi:histidine kinase [Saccharopolyspora sp. NPDC050389]|uniref:sensor histidine kinase n=1 Tax=Saccharopolyspora sp. NPDC050389 TaxID=3155516 RepID=UPI0033CF5555